MANNRPNGTHHAYPCPTWKPILLSFLSICFICPQSALPERTAGRARCPNHTILQSFRSQTKDRPHASIWMPRRFSPPRTDIARPTNPQEATDPEIQYPRHLHRIPAETGRISDIPGGPNRHDTHHRIPRRDLR